MIEQKQSYEFVRSLFERYHDLQTGLRYYGPWVIECRNQRRFFFVGLGHRASGRKQETGRWTLQTTWLRETYCTTCSNFCSCWTLRWLLDIKTAQATDTLATDVHKKIVDIPMVGYPDLTENGSAEGATDLHKNWEVVAGALIYKGRRYSGPLHPYRLSANMTTDAASKAATMLTYGLGLRSFSWRTGRARVLAHLQVWWVWPVTGMLTS